MSSTKYIDSDRNPLATFAVFIGLHKVRIQAYPGPVRSAWTTIMVGSCIALLRWTPVEIRMRCYRILY
jgi:hypothetical protein